MDRQGKASFGETHSELAARIDVHEPEFYRHVVLGGGIGVAESLAQGHWSSPDLTSLVRVLIRNLHDRDAVNGSPGVVRNVLEKGAHFLRRNTIGRARQNILQHYDLSNEFFQLFLDRSMTYSSAIFPRPDCTLYEGSIEKIDLVCRKLGLKPSDHLIEIGTGWGALAEHAVKHYGCRVTTTTISDRQHEFAKQRFRKAGVADRITLLKKDYRHLTGQYDKLVSIEMIEAVGHRYLATFFDKCTQLLRPDGEMLIQAITIVDHRFAHHVRTVDFIKRFIFPGGCLPSVTALLQAMTNTSRMRMIHMEDFAVHYAETLRRWRSRFHEQLPHVRKLGFDERFIRIWEYYFCYCEAAFMERQVNVSQLWFANYRSQASPRARDFHSRVVERPAKGHSNRVKREVLS